MNQADEAHVGVGRLLASYADVVTRRAWSELGPLFLPDAAIHVQPADRAAVDLVGPGALGEFVSAAIERFGFFEIVILNSVVVLAADGATATGRAYIAEYRQERDSGLWSTAFGLYEDRYVARDGGWVFARRNYRNLARKVD